jgi:UDP-N-acetylmuramoyl-L-alanyl-D-glutamate--2,6-diaminopimelate ligase
VHRRSLVTNKSEQPPPPPPWHGDLLSVGVTGTNGKTTTTTYIAEALSRVCSPVARVTTLGFWVGAERVALPPGYETFVETMRRTHALGGRFAAVEMTSYALARGFIRAWPCQIGVFTNATRDHLDSHGSPEHYLASKAQLFALLPAGGGAVLNAADPASELLVEVIPPGVRRLRYALSTRGPSDPDVELFSSAAEVSFSGTAIHATTRGALLGEHHIECRTRAIGEVYAENALAAYAAARLSGVPHELSLQAIAETAVPPGRFEVVAERPWVVVDYAHTPDALTRALRTARQLSPSRVSLVFGAGGNRDREKRPLMGSAAAGADRIVLTSDNPRDEDPRTIVAAIRSGIPSGPAIAIEEELDRARAIEHAIHSADSDELILIAGKGHETEQIVAGERLGFSDADVARAAHRRRAR